MTAHSAPVAVAHPIASMRFTTEHERPRDQFDAWREITRAISYVEKPDFLDEGYRATLDVHDLGPIQLVSFRQQDVVFDRTADHVRRSGIDHWMLSVVKRGKLHSGTSEREYRASGGSVLFKSFAEPFSGAMEATEFSGIYLSRDDFWYLSDRLDKVSHRLVHGPMADVLGDFLLSVERHAPTLSRADVPALNEAFANLLSAALVPGADSIEAAKPVIAASQFERARHFINENLASPRLNADLVSVALGISRRQLSYLFEMHGGIASYIRDRRLATCHKALTTTTRRKYIGAIAYEHGFTNVASFNRQFRAKYGFGPGEARAAWMSGDRPVSAKVTTFGEWMTRVPQH
ncbi:MAG: helix-turn-helix domain-containing protein [Rhizobiaceae bacterium]|nr:helix-turn-helix domain-containing protein [Rhizobiaceae bacterium]